MHARPALLLAACAVAAAACSGDVLAAPVPPVAYDDGAVSFTHPADWAVLDGVSAADGTPTLLAVGYLDGAGNLVGLAVDTVEASPAVPPGEERAYLETVFARHAGAIWGDAVVEEEGWAALGSRDARRYVVRSSARGEGLSSEILVAVEGAVVVVIQCQVPVPAPEEAAAGCAMALATLEVASFPADSAAAAAP